VGSAAGLISSFLGEASDESLDCASLLSDWPLTTGSVLCVPLTLAGSTLASEGSLALLSSSFFSDISSAFEVETLFSSLFSEVETSSSSFSSFFLLVESAESSFFSLVESAAESLDLSLSLSSEVESLETGAGVGVSSVVLSTMRGWG